MTTAAPQPLPHTFADMRLTRIAVTDPQRCATVNEYAGATGIAIPRVLELLAPALENQVIELEPVGGEIFVHTAPTGRAYASLPANLWETLRRGRDVDTAFALWRLVRGLEQGGWSVETDPDAIPVVEDHTTLLALRFRTSSTRPSLVPLLVLPDPAEMAGHYSPLSRYDRAGVMAVAVACHAGELDRMATSVRQWLLGRSSTPRLKVLLLEKPRYQPVVISGSDTSVAPRAVSIVQFEDMLDQ